MIVVITREYPTSLLDWKNVDVFLLFEAEDKTAFKK